MAENTKVTSEEVKEEKVETAKTSNTTKKKETKAPKKKTTPHKTQKTSFVRGSFYMVLRNPFPIISLLLVIIMNAWGCTFLI